VQSLGYAQIPSVIMSRATSFSAMMQQLMQSFGVGLVALVVHLNTTLHGRVGMTADDIAIGFFTIGLFSALGVLIFYRMPPTAGSELTGR
jgi:hypothetical protein